MRRHLPMEPDEVAGGVIGRSEEDHHTSMLATSKFSLPPADFKTLHQIGSRPSSWSYSVTDAQEEDERRADGMSSDGEYMQTGRFEWTSSVEGSEGHSQLMMVRSDPPAITMPVFRRALQLGSVQEAWQSGNYSGEEAQVEVEEEDDDEDDEEGSVYTCIECSIYFKKKAHLLEHMFQHTQEGEREGTQTGDGPHTCGECGKYFGDESSLTSHRQLHQESRQKIMEEIRKLESLADEGRGARLQCPKCLFGTNSSKVFVQHAKTHVKKGSGENRTTSTSLRMPADTVMGSSAEEGNDGAWKNSETETESEQEWGMEVSRAVMVGGLQGPSKVKMKTPPRAGTGICAKGEQQRVGGSQKTSLVLPETAVQLKKKFQEALKVGGEGEEGQRRQLREEVAVVVLENLSYKKKSPKESQALGYDKRTFGSSGGLSSQSFTSASELHLPREEWPEDGEGDLPLDILLMDPTYEGQLEALGLRSEERECPYCPDRFHNGIGLANHVRGHLNRVGVSYNVRHFISAEEVKAIEQNYSIQKKRKKVANFDPSTFSLMRCEFCGAGFDTRAGLSSHARAHLRDFGITNWELTVSPIHVLARLLARSPGRPLPPFPAWHQDTDTDVLLDESEKPAKERVTVPSNMQHLAVLGSDEEEDIRPLDLGMSQNPKLDTGRTEKMPSDQSTSRAEDPKEMAEGKGGDQASKVSDAGAHSMPEDNGEPKETSVHFKSPGGVGSSTQVKIVEAGVSHAMSSEGAAHSKLAEAGSSMVKTEAGRPPSKLSETGTHHKTSLSGLSHTRLPPPSGTPPAKKLKTTSPACKSNMDSFWTTNNSSTPLNLSPGSEEVRCEFCGEFFENRKGLSSHARSHLRQMGVTEWHVNGSPIDTLREILASGTYPRAGTRVGGPNLEKRHPHPPPSSPSRPMPYSGLASSMQRKPPRLPTFHEWPSDLSPLNLSSRADPARDIRCEFCNEFFENRKGLSSHARSHLRQMGVTEWHVNGSPIDTLREIIRKRHLQSPQLSNIKKEPRGNDEPTGSSHLHSTHGMGSLGVSALGRAHNAFLSPMPTKRPASHEPRLTQSEPKTYVRVEPKPSTHSQAKAYVQGEARHKSYMQDENRHKAFIQGEGRPKSYVQGDPRPKTYIQSDGRPKTYIHGDSRPKPYGQGETKHKPYSQSDGRLKQYMHGDNKPKGYGQGDGKPKAYIQTELPFKVKVKPSPDKPPTTLEACCELCGLYFENRKALASHARAHLRQFGVTEWCVNGSPIETLREWMKQRPQKAGAYLSYIQGGRPFAKKFKRSSQIPKAAAAEKDSAAATSAKVAEADRVLGASGPVVDKLEGQGQKAERRQSKLPEIPPSREDSLTDSLPKSEEPKPAPRPRPVPSLVPRPPQTSLVKFVGNIYTLKCRFCDIQFQGPLSIQEQWVRHLQHHILEMNFSKPPSSPTLASPPQSEPAKA
ncbi:protein Wiz isoform X6 [Spea bombifrons]|uniref:protein Wiz isoform X6 n=1 Tax=Spea bombifrons TaxID=233779 RepID=UPI00234B1A63|nr:protein Wiz isoform X6 [Spea bombifrons]